MKKTIFVSYILDESGSMGSITNSVISGFNEYLGSLKREKKVNYKFSLTKFDSTGLRMPYVATDIAKVKDLDTKSYVPGQNTPLYDAVCKTVLDLEKKVKGKQPVIVAIMTDGMENASREFDERTLQAMIKRLTDKGNWTFAFMGANQDSWAMATKWGIPVGNIANWKATPQGTQAAFYAMSASNETFAFNSVSRGITQSDSYFSKDDDN